MLLEVGKYSGTDTFICVFFLEQCQQTLQPWRIATTKEAVPLKTNTCISCHDLKLFLHHVTSQTKFSIVCIYSNLCTIFFIFLF